MLKETKTKVRRFLMEDKKEIIKFVLKKENGNIFINGIETKHEPSAEELIN